MKSCLKFIKHLFLLYSFFCVQTLLYSADPPTMGWSSWNTYRVNISDSLICKQAQALLDKGLAACGYKYVNIDDGYFGGRDKEGRLLIHPTRFPNGLRPVVDYIHSLGLKAGIYSDAGRNTCGNFWDSDTIGVGVGFYGHDQEDATFFFDSLRFDFIKIDFCGGDPKQNSEHLQLSERERYFEISSAIRKVNSNVRMNLCRWAFPGTWAAKISSSWRISQDISASWESIRNILLENRYLSAYAVNGVYNDMDMLEIGRGLSEAEERTHFAMWCIQSSPLLIGCDLTTIPEASLRLITNPELIAVNQDSLNLQATICKFDNGIYIFAKDLEQRFNTIRAVAICNPTDYARYVKWAWSDVGLSDVTQVRDLIARRTLPDIMSDSTEVYLPPHDTRIFKVTARHRLMQHVYEAENAWLERYQELGMNPELGYPIYFDDINSSAGAKVINLGNHPDNWLEWRNVYVFKEGLYELSFCGEPRKGTTFYCYVNGELQDTVHYRNNAIVPKLSVKLNKGVNVVRLSNADQWMPDIDYMRVIPLSKQTN